MIALFDLDDTLLNGDSNLLWGRFFVDRGVVDAAAFARRQAYFDAEYHAGTIAFSDYLSFTATPLRARARDEVAGWQRLFAAEYTRGAVFPEAVSLLESHRRRGHALVIVTATARVFAEPFARLLNVHALLGSELEQVDGHFTGQPSGQPCYREGKLAYFLDWLDTQRRAQEETWFYTDSHNDIPLLEHVDHPCAVNPDSLLHGTAQARGWPILQFR